MLLKINPENPQKRLIRKVVEVLRNGGVIGYPTDTIYGIGCSIYNTEGIKKIRMLKKQNNNKPLSFICSDLKNISEYAYVSNYAYKTIKRLIPGGYTFILKATKLVPKIMLTKQKTVGIRVPNNKICLEMVKELGHPIITTSIFNSKDELFTNSEEVEEQFGKALDLIIDGGSIPAIHSTIVDFTDEVPVILRKGKGDISTLVVEE
ncbi:MAG: threonylcarbamoyl-AMP synthase [Deltaproteobacteria bacterium]|nr:threonylcarbamoyl-AMP synthase [Deltaproteobacteria bacterium]